MHLLISSNVTKGSFFSLVIDLAARAMLVVATTDPAAVIEPFKNALREILELIFPLFVDIALIM
jgi:hypothetical protein